MREQYDFSKGVRGNPYAARLALLHRSRDDSSDEEVPPLTRAQVRELRRRVRDARDRTRFLLLKSMAPDVRFYYNASHDTYAVNQPRHATIFKRRAAAAAVKRTLGSRVSIIQCRVNNRDELVLNSLPSVRKKRRRS